MPASPHARSPVSRRLNDQSEHDDLARSLLGDGEAFGRLVARYQIQVARRMRAFVRQPRTIEELVQEVFVEAYYSLRSYRGDGEFAAWLNRIATRVGYRYWKRRDRSREIVHGADWWRAVPEGRVEGLDPSRAAELVRILLDQLPPRDRLVLLLLHVEGRSIAEAARLAGWSQTMIRVQAFRARAKLRLLLAKADMHCVEDVADGENSRTDNLLATDLPDRRELNRE